MTDVKRHYDAKHTNTVFGCVDCDAEFHYKSHLKRHRQKPCSKALFEDGFKCTWCTKTFKTKNKVDAHEKRIHFQHITNK